MKRMKVHPLNPCKPFSLNFTWHQCYNMWFNFLCKKHFHPSIFRLYIFSTLSTISCKQPVAQDVCWIIWTTEMLSTSSFIRLILLAASLSLYFMFSSSRLAILPFPHFFWWFDQFFWFHSSQISPLQIGAKQYLHLIYEEENL